MNSPRNFEVKKKERKGSGRPHPEPKNLRVVPGPTLALRYPYCEANAYNERKFNRITKFKDGSALRLKAVTEVTLQYM